MLDTLIHIDHQLFNFINQSLSNSFFDFIMPYIRNKKTWIPLYVLLGFLLLKNDRKKGMLIIGLGILSVLLADGISSHLLKPSFERIRPCLLTSFADHVNLLLSRCSGAFSFPSSHAANHFALGTFLALVFKSSKKYLSYFLLFWASTICFAQVYVGVHFPSDVLVGALLGIIIAILLYQLYLVLLKIFFVKTKQ